MKENKVPQAKKKKKKKTLPSTSNNKSLKLLKLEMFP